MRAKLTTSFKNVQKFAYTILFCLISIHISQAQDRDNQTNIQTGIPYSISDIENINLTNGNVMFNFNLGNLPKGRGTTGGGISLKYNSKLYTSQYNEVTGPNGQPDPELFLTDAPESGWQYDEGRYRLKAISRNDGSDHPTQISGECGKPNYKAVYVWKVMLYFPDGSQHEFRPTGYSDTDQDIFGQLQTGDGYFNVSLSGVIRNLAWSAQVGGPPSCNGGVYNTYLGQSQHPSSTMTYYSSDGTYMRLVVPTGQDARYPNNWTVYMPDGSKIVNSSNHGQRVYDRNGNYIEKGNVTLPDSSQVPGLFDQFGRYVAKKQISTLEDQIYSLGTAGETLKWTVKWKYISVVRRYRTSSAVQIERGGSNQLFCSTQKVVDEIIPPEQIGNLKYNFTYKANDGSGTGCSVSNPTFSPGWGELMKVTLPSGAEAEYKYALLSLPGETSNSPGAVLPYTNLMLKSLGKIKEKTLSYNSEYDGAVTPVTEKWSYDIDTTSSKITSPDGSISQQAFHSSGSKAGSVYWEKKPDGTIIERLWLNNQPNGFLFGSYRKLNNYIKTEFVTIPDASGNPYLTAIKDFSYDKNGNVIKITEYDWVSPGSIPRNENSEVTGIPSGASILRTTENSYYNQTEEALNTTVNNANSYWNSTAQPVINALSSTKIKNANGGVVAYSEFSYDNPNTAANLVETRAWDSTKPQGITYPLTSANAVISSVEYDVYGNPVWATDARGVQTTITYGAVNGYAGLYPTQTEAASNYITLKRTSTAQYDFSTGLLLSSTDVDNNITSKTEYDALGRPTKGIAAYNTPFEIWTQTVYDNVNRRIIVKSDIETKGDAKKVATQFYDQLGRVRLSKTLESAAQSATNETDGIKVQTRYLTTNGYTYQLASNPYRAVTSAAATGEPEMGWTRSKAINTGKHSELETFAGAVLPAPWGSSSSSTGIVQTDINADRTLVTDQAGKQRISKTNVLGQLADVWEIMPADSATEPVSFGNLNLNAYRTSYAYDTLNNLVAVNQGSQTRSFTYSSLSRLKSATNPESGLLQYTYDNNGNLLTKTDARIITTTYTYDALNRVIFRDYSDSTPDVAYTYDNLPNAKGKLTKVMNGNLTGGTIANPFSVTEYQAFDQMGRVTQSQQWVEGASYGDPMTYTYNLSGALIEEKYPSGRVVKNVLDNDGDLSVVQSKKNQTAGFWNYADHFTYTAAGAVSSMQLGNGRWESTTFNSRLQPTQIALGTVQNGSDKLNLNFSYNTTGQNDNNGNVLSQTIIVPTEVRGSTTHNGFTATQTYTYDSLNRIKQANELITGQIPVNWQQTFQYDRYGNRTFDEANTTVSVNFPKACGASPNLTMCAADKKIYNPQAQTSNNKFSTSDGYLYDASGNTTRDAQSRKFTYDAENHQTKVETVDGSGNPISILGEYFYDSDGKRVKKIASNEVTIFIYDAQGKLMAEYANQTTQTPTVNYLTSDHLGSPRINTDANGAVIARHDYQPFGEEITRASYGVDNIKEQFTGYERDIESSLDFAQARYFNSGFGRFTSPDDFLKDSSVAEPQSWNKYVYARNSPLKYIDPNGEEATVSIETDENKKTITVKISASFLFYAEKGVSNKDRDKAAQDAAQNIANAWSGTYKNKDGFTVKVETTVTYATINGDEKVANEAANDYGIQNVIGLVNGNADKSADSRSGSSLLSSSDHGRWNINSIANGVAQHEFGHLLGVWDKEGNVVLNTDILNDPNITRSATADDYEYVLKNDIANHREESRGMPNSKRENYKSTVILRAGYVFWK